MRNLMPARKDAAKPITAIRTAAKTARRSVRTGTRATRRVARTGARAAGTGARLGLDTVQLVLRTPPPGRREGRRGSRLTIAALAGAGIEYLMDPADGRRRRRLLVDRTRSTARRLARHGAREARNVQGQAAGILHEATAAATPPADDQALADRVRSEIFRRPDAAKGEVNVDVVDGVVSLRGELDDQAEIDQLVSGARAVPGVREVDNMLHVKEAPAPESKTPSRAPRKSAKTPRRKAPSAS